MRLAWGEEERVLGGGVERVPMAFVANLFQSVLNIIIEHHHFPIDS